MASGLTEESYPDNNFPYPQFQTSVPHEQFSQYNIAPGGHDSHLAYSSRSTSPRLFNYSVSHTMPPTPVGSMFFHPNSPGSQAPYSYYPHQSHSPMPISESGSNGDLPPSTATSFAYSDGLNSSAIASRTWPENPVSDRPMQTFGHVPDDPYRPYSSSERGRTFSGGQTDQKELAGKRLRGADTLKSYTQSDAIRNRQHPYSSPGDMLSKTPESDGSKVFRVSRDEQPKGSLRSHNIVEKRYRTNINNSIAAFQDIVPALAHLRDNQGAASKKQFSTGGSAVQMLAPSQTAIDGVVPPATLSKGTILHKGIEYIKFLKETRDVLTEDMNMLQWAIQDVVGDKALEQIMDNFHSRKLVSHKQKSIATSSGLPLEPEGELEERSPTTDSDSASIPSK